MQQLIPLSTSPNQNLIVSLNVNNAAKDLLLSLHYNEIAHYWATTIRDAAGNLILDSLPLVTGNAPAGNLLGQFEYLGIGGATIINAGQVAADYPDNTNLGKDFVLIWYDNE